MVYIILLLQHAAYIVSASKRPVIVTAYTVVLPCGDSPPPLTIYVLWPLQQLTCYNSLYHDNRPWSYDLNQPQLSIGSLYMHILKQLNYRPLASYF